MSPLHTSLHLSSIFSACYEQHSLAAVKRASTHLSRLVTGALIVRTVIWAEVLVIQQLVQHEAAMQLGGYYL